MSQKISLWGATYNDVPSVLLPKSGGGTAQFDDTTIASNAAAASDIASGKYAYVNGSLILGTGSGGGGGGSVTQDQDGYIVLPATGGSTPSVSGLEYETGTLIPSADTARPAIYFTDTHTEPPSYFTISDVHEATGLTADSILFVEFTCNARMFGTPFPYNASGNYFRYATWHSVYENTNSAVATSQGTCGKGINETPATTTNYPLYWADETAIYPSADSASRYFRAGRTYKWIAVWAPTT